MRIEKTYIEIMGSMWTVVSRTDAEDKKLDGISGYTDHTAKMIVLLDEEPDVNSVSDLHSRLQSTIRHEIIHAFLYECGLWADSSAHEHWVMNEEMVDWFALKLPEIQRACERANAMPWQRLASVEK